MITIDEEQFFERILLTADPSNIDFYKKGESFLPDLCNAVIEDCIKWSQKILQSELELLNEIFYQCRKICWDDTLDPHGIEENYIAQAFPYYYISKKKNKKIPTEDGYYVFSYVSALLSELYGVSEEIVNFAHFIKTHIESSGKEMYLRRAEQKIASIKEKRGSIAYDFSPNPSVEQVIKQVDFFSITTCSKQGIEYCISYFRSIDDQCRILDAIIEYANKFFIPLFDSIEQFREDVKAGKYLKNKEGTEPQKAMAALDEEIVNELLPLFWNNREQAHKFIAAIKGQTSTWITRHVNALGRDVIPFENRKKKLWTVLHDHGLYDKSVSNWNNQIN